MKITRSQLKRLIKEEFNKVLEGAYEEEEEYIARMGKWAIPFPDAAPYKVVEILPDGRVEDHLTDLETKDEAMTNLKMLNKDTQRHRARTARETKPRFGYN